MSDNLKLSDVDFLPSAREERAGEKPPAPATTPAPGFENRPPLSRNKSKNMAIRFTDALQRRAATVLAKISSPITTVVKLKIRRCGRVKATWYRRLRVLQNA